MLDSEKAVEQKIIQAMERGEFADLQGQGYPINLDDDIHVPKELRMGFRILRNAGVSPVEIQVLKEINKLKLELKLTSDKNYKQLLISQISVLQTNRNF